MKRNNRKKSIEFLDYINNPLSDASITVIYKANNVKYDRCRLYSKFVRSLLMIIFDTYLGDSITDNNQRVEHFNWCWEENLLNFNKQGFIFDDLTELQDYFKEFMVEVYYSVENKEEKLFINDNLLSLWDFIFDFEKPKSRSDIDSFIEIYSLMEKSLKKS